MVCKINMMRKRICFITSTPQTINAFLRPHINVLMADYDVALVSNGSKSELVGLPIGEVAFFPLQICRKISIIKDILALISLWRLFRKEKFDSVHSITPKAGLLTMLAAKFAGIQLRFHTFTGQVWATQQGGRRIVLKELDRVLAMSATHVFADSESQRLFLINNKVVKSSAINVLADGSISGVDVNRFKYNESIRLKIRAGCQIPSDAIVFLFVGRLTYDKGLLDLLSAFASAAEKCVNIHLMIVGPDEDGLESKVSILLQKFSGRVHRVGFTNSPEDYMTAADVFCLPSYREGFGSVIIEAASVGLPTIASRIYGITDAIEDGVTGILHSPASVLDISEAMLFFASNAAARCKMGAAARVRANNIFSEACVTKAFSDFYRDVIPITT